MLNSVSFLNNEARRLARLRSVATFVLQGTSADRFPDPGLCASIVEDCALSLDHFIGLGEDGRRDGEAGRLCRLQNDLVGAK